MPEHRTLLAQYNRSWRSDSAALLLMSILAITGPASSVMVSKATELVKSPVRAGLVTGSSVDAVIIVASPAVMLRWSPANYALDPRAGKILKEIGKQTIDQPGHFLIGAAPIWASRYLVGVPWYGWAIAPLLAYREWLQWPSKRWWDPPLDWAFLSIGAVVATCRGGSARRSLDRLQPLRRRIARKLSFALARWRATASHVRAALAPGTARRRRSLSAAAKAGSRR